MSNYDFVKSGTLKPPRLIGRIVRLLLGTLSLWGASMFILPGIHIFYQPFNQPLAWFSILFALWLLNHVVNIGWKKQWGRLPQLIWIGAVTGSVLISLLVSGNPWNRLLGLLLYWMPLYVYLHLGISFVLSAIIATPGCEMRALPHLLSIMLRRPVNEHVCPGPLDNLDRWEYRRSEP